MKNFINEISRMKELMGLSLIKEEISVGGLKISTKNGNLYAKNQEYEMCTPKTLLGCVDLGVEEVFKKDGGFMIRLDTPIGKTESNIPTDKMKEIISQIGKDEIEFEGITPKGDEVTIRLNKV